MGFGAFRTTCPNCGYQAATTGGDCPRCGARQGISDGQAAAGGVKLFGVFLWCIFGPGLWYAGCNSSTYGMAAFGVVVTLLGIARLGK